MQVNKQCQDKELLFSVTQKDFTIQTFRSGGRGGQRQDKVNTGVRIIHSDSGARGESRTERSQNQNKKLAFQHLVKTKLFKDWLRISAAKAMGEFDNLDHAIDVWMQNKNLKIEVKEQGHWVLT